MYVCTNTNTLLELHSGASSLMSKSRVEFGVL